MITLKIRSNREIGSVIRGVSVRPAMLHKDRKKEDRRKACRGNRKWD